MAGPQGKHFNIEGKTLLPKYSLVWEGASTAVRVTLAAQDKKIDLDVSLGVEEVSAVHIEKHEVVFDIDYLWVCQNTNPIDSFNHIHCLFRRQFKFFNITGSSITYVF